jgi:signal transduction histidine kinase/CheY-like chemotaxis protein
MHWRAGLPGFVLRYGAALLAVLAAAGVRWALQPAMGVAPPYITFYLAIVVAAAIGGFGPGLFATLLGGLLGIGLANLPVDKLQLGTVAEQLRLTIYLLSGLGISLIAAGMHNARRRAREEAEQLRRSTEELRVANERLVEADRSKDHFLAVLSHELRNPLMPIKHSLYVLEKVPSDAEPARRARASIERQIDQMTRLVNDLLDVTRISRDKLTLQRDRFDLRQVVSRTVEDHRAVFMARGIRVDARQPERPLWIHGDAARISQVFGNVLHNAAKFTRHGGEVRVSLEERDGQAVLRVRDNGVGISAEMLARIFEPFMQAEQGLDRGAGGLGLGLTLVKRLVELHGGSVEARSAGEGEGAEFTITLPLDTQPEAGADPEPRPVSRSPRRVLVIEDNVDSADTLRLLLRINGHEVEVCYSGAEGLGKARAFNPDAVLCDIGLPGMDGYELARAFRQDPALSRTTLVALTGYASREDRDRAMAAGFDRHLVKPSSIEELERVLNESRTR